MTNKQASTTPSLNRRHVTGDGIIDPEYVEVIKVVSLWAY